jgi:hypothetical protein
VAHVAGNNTDVTGLEVKSARSAFASENGDAGTAFDEIRPFVGVGYDVLENV